MKTATPTTHTMMVMVMVTVMVMEIAMTHRGQQRRHRSSPHPSAPLLHEAPVEALTSRAICAPSRGVHTCT
jgi:hypothetical protein